MAGTYHNKFLVFRKLRSIYHRTVVQHQRNITMET